MQSSSNEFGTSVSDSKNLNKQRLIQNASSFAC